MCKDNKQFWKTVNTCLTDKTIKGERIKKESNERELVKDFNEYFSNIVPSIDI